MNIQNVVRLAEMVKGLGFDEGLSNELLKRVSLRIPSFVIARRQMKERDVVYFHIYFERKDDSYHFKYYDASLRKDMEIPQTLQALDKKMEAINWADAFSFASTKAWSADEVSSWKTEAQIEAVMSEIESLEDKEAAGRLKVKHWADIDQDVFNLQFLRSKYEITQRFYFFEGQGCIGADEAYRFLHNRWMEKQMVAQRKAASAEDERDGSGNGRSGKLLQKKRPPVKRKSGLIS